MATRQIIRIDETKCDGCGLCVPACAEGAIQVIDGKARLVSETYCDGLGACLGECPQGAITIEEREAAPFDEEAVARHLEAEASASGEADAGQRPRFELPAGGCPGAAAMPTGGGCPGSRARTLQPAGEAAEAPAGGRPSALGNWPVQLALAPPRADYFDDTEILLAADCTAFAMNGLHESLLAGRTALIACPKLDETGPYVEKLAAILRGNRVQRLVVARMSVPCCGGLERIALAAREASGAGVPVSAVIIGPDGSEEERRDLAPAAEA